MYLDIIDIRDFYSSLLGRVVARSVEAAVSALMPPDPKARVLGFGFATPYLGRLRGNCERVLAFMPAGQGVLDWPPEGPSVTALVEEDALPLPDQSMDCVLIVHALEMSPKPLALMAEARRVLTIGGKLIVVVPNRQGAWSRFDISPFGFGQPYSRGQLRSLFAEAGFEAEAWATALHMPPFSHRSMLAISGTLDRAGQRTWPAFSGVICARATKRNIQGVRVRSRRVLSPALRPVLQPSGLAGLHRTKAHAAPLLIDPDKEQTS